MALLLRRSLQRSVTRYACSLGEFLRLAGPAACQATKGKDINFKGHLNLLILALEARERHEDSEKGFWRRILELSFEGVCKMRKGKSILVKRRASKKE